MAKDKDVEEMISDCESAVGIDRSHGGPGFGSWEEGFIESIREQFDERGSLTDKQIEKLTELWNKI
jgi:hypothetical protein